jgi:hypothetical protein
VQENTPQPPAQFRDPELCLLPLEDIANAAFGRVHICVLLLETKATAQRGTLTKSGIFPTETRLLWIPPSNITETSDAT